MAQLMSFCPMPKTYEKQLMFVSRPHSRSKSNHRPFSFKFEDADDDSITNSKPDIQREDTKDSRTISKTHLRPFRSKREGTEYSRTRSKTARGPSSCLRIEDIDNSRTARRTDYSSALRNILALRSVRRRTDRMMAVPGAGIEGGEWA